MRFIALLLLALLSCTQKNSMYMGNPAAQKCTREGGRIVTVAGEGGEYGVCILRGNSICEEWKFFRGECRAGDCMLTCRDAGSGSEGLYDCRGKLVLAGPCGRDNK